MKKFLTRGLKNWGTLIVVCSVVILFIIIDYYYRQEVEEIYYLMFLLLCTIVGFNAIKVQKIKHEFDKRELESAMQEIYSNAYRELIFEVRRKQHDFLNQLGAIYSMHLTATSLEDLIKKQSEYGNVMLEEYRYDEILMGCNNPILAGYLYYKCVSCEKEGVKIEYQVRVDDAKCRLSLHEVIEVLGILLTNAIENYDVKMKDKSIDLIVIEDDKCLSIEVRNIVQQMTTQEIQKIFSRGYSSKGENRGIGLARVKQLTETSGAGLLVKNFIKEEHNWLSFKIIIPK